MPSLPHERYTPAELAAQYDTAGPLPGGNVAPYFARFEAESARARRDVAHVADVRYGPHPREVLDAFPARAPGAPLFLFVHGGYWRRLSKDAFSFVAPPLVAAGAAVAVVSYPLAPEAALDDIVAAVRRATAFARARAATWNADPARLVLGGHSVGAQLAATSAAAYAVAGLLAISGIYDLQPLRATPVNDWIAMDAAVAARNSPLATPPLGTPPLVVAVGERERAEFHRQQRAVVDAWRGWGCAVQVVDASGHDHFSIVLALADAASPLSRALRATMSLAPGEPDGR